jgi:DNA-binding transcriptional MerR regulator
MKTMNIGRLAKLPKVDVDTIRYYERTLLCSAARLLEAVRSLRRVAETSHIREPSDG